MSEYPWDMENMILAQHDQPCDCAICDDIHMARLMRRKRREVVAEFGSMSAWEQMQREMKSRDDEIRRLRADLESMTQHAQELEIINRNLQREYDIRDRACREALKRLEDHDKILDRLSGILKQTADHWIGLAEIIGGKG